jgi:hypothetical protein
VCTCEEQLNSLPTTACYAQLSCVCSHQGPPRLAAVLTHYIVIILFVVIKGLHVWLPYSPTILPHLCLPAQRFVAGCAAGATAGCVQHTGTNQHRTVPQDIQEGAPAVRSTAQPHDSVTPAPEVLPCCFLMTLWWGGCGSGRTHVKLQLKLAQPQVSHWQCEALILTQFELHSWPEGCEEGVEPSHAGRSVARYGLMSESWSCYASTEEALNTALCA